MIKSLEVADFTVFPKAKFDFGRHLNVIVGENGVGKTHVLKLAYSIVAAHWEAGRGRTATKGQARALPTHLSEKLIGVFRPDSPGRLVRSGRDRSKVALTSTRGMQDIRFTLPAESEGELAIDKMPKGWIPNVAVYFPTRELLTIYPNFVSVYDGHYLEFEATWRDTCSLLGAPLLRGPRAARVKDHLAPLEVAMAGTIELDKNGRFYLHNASGRIEMPLVAEGLRKLGMLARLIATGALLSRGCLFWDEPEANLNPTLIKRLARSIVELATSGTQIFIATHSLFLLRELEIVAAGRPSKLEARYFGLHEGGGGVEVAQGTSIDDIGSIASLDEELAQSDRFLEEST